MRQERCTVVHSPLIFMEVYHELRGKETISRLLNLIIFKFDADNPITPHFKNDQHTGILVVCAVFNLPFNFHFYVAI